MVTKVSQQIYQQNNETIQARTWDNFYVATSYGLVGNGTTNDSAALSTLINTTIDGDNATIIFPAGNYLIGSNLTIPSNVMLFIPLGAKFTVSSGVTLTLNCNIQAGRYQIFDVSGTVSGTVLNDEIYPEWFGATGSGTTDDSTAIQRAIDLAEAALGQVVSFLDKTYIAQSLTITQPCTIRGRGQSATTITTNSTTLDVFTVDASYVKFLDLTIRRVSVASNGAAIKLNSGTFATIERVAFGENHFYHVNAVSGYLFTIKNSYFVSAIQYAIYIRNNASPDSGDQVIEGCTFDTTVNTPAAIRHESGGGLKVYGCKILQHQIGYDLQVADGTSTTVTILDGNSIEMQTVRHIRLGRLGTTGTYSMINISNNQHNIASTITEGYLIANGISSVDISNNITNGYSSAPFLNLTGGSEINVNGNQVNNWQTGVKVAAPVSGVTVGINAYKSVGKPIEDNTTSTSVTRSPLIDHLYNKNFPNVTSTSTYTNLFQLDLDTFRSYTFEITFEGILQGVSSIGRHIKKVVKRDGSACSLTDVTDTNAGAVFDVQFDTTTTSGSVIIGIKRAAASGGTSLVGSATIRIYGHVQGVNIL